tara:strand:- start:2628 stop:3401 length:774 start_codon:yes stop_codon:yes gene_type:complete
MINPRPELLFTLNWMDVIKNYDWEPVYNYMKDNQYFLDITGAGEDGMAEVAKYWDVHLSAFEDAGIASLPKTVKWLDIGTFFGILPFSLQQLGFTDVHCTDSAINRVGYEEKFNKLWEHFNIAPDELHVLPLKRFELKDKYDVITITKSNLFWKTDEVIHYDGKKISNEWHVEGVDGLSHTYFSVYKKEEWEFFIENLKEFLNPGGVAIINPEPWVYTTIPSTFPARDYLTQFMPTNPKFVDSWAKPGLSNYMIIRK